MESVTGLRAIAVAGVATALAVGGVTACGGHADTSGRPAGSPAAVVTPAAVATVAPVVTATPSAVAVVTHKHAAPIVATLSPLDPVSTVIATASHRIAVYTAPDGPLLRHFSARTSLDSARTFLVTGTQGSDWLQVELPIRPNGSRGWIRTASVTTTTTPMAIDVDRRAHVLTLLRAGQPVRQFAVAVGARATPTPAGAFFISDRLPTLAPYGPFGPYALGLSGYSNVLLTFDGADGVLGIHGTNADWSVGHAVSHGCIRMHNRDVTWLYRRIPLGAAVIVH